MQEIKAANQESELKTYQDSTIRSKKVRLFNKRIIKERLMKKAYYPMAQLRKKQQNS